MSMYLLQVKLSQTVTQSLVLACCALTMVGCNRTPDAKEEKNASATAQTQADNGSAVKCSSEQATSAIHTYLVNRLQQQASSQAQMIEQQASTVVDRSILQNNLNQIAVNLESVNGNQGQCRATVSFNMPQSQLDNADKIYARLRLPVVAQQVVSRGYQLQNRTVVAKNIGFGVAASGDSYQINTTTGDDLIALAGEMVANATLAQTLSQPSNLSATGNVPTTITPPPVRRDVTGNTEPKKAQPTGVKHIITDLIAFEQYVKSQEFDTAKQLREQYLKDHPDVSISYNAFVDTLHRINWTFKKRPSPTKNQTP